LSDVNPWWQVLLSPQVFFLLATVLIIQCSSYFNFSAIGLRWPAKKWWICPILVFIFLVLLLWGLHGLLKTVDAQQLLVAYGLSIQNGLMLFILAPISEELFFRGIVFHALRRVHPLWISMGVSSLLFMATHSQLWLGTLAMGVINAWWTHRSRSIMPGVLFHMLCNGLPWLIYNHLPRLGTLERLLFF
jgi:membrane protease YdiL (CAAX protease family)